MQTGKIEKIVTLLVYSHYICVKKDNEKKCHDISRRAGDKVKTLDE